MTCRSFLKTASSILSVSFATSLSSQTVSDFASRIAAEPITFLPKPAWKTGIVATVFWIGERPTKKNPTPNTASSWDRSWMGSFGGFDDPTPGKRAANFRPASFVPKRIFAKSFGNV